MSLKLLDINTLKADFCSKKMTASALVPLIISGVIFTFLFPATIAFLISSISDLVHGRDVISDIVIVMIYLTIPYGLFFVFFGIFLHVRKRQTSIETAIKNGHFHILECELSGFYTERDSTGEGPASNYTYAMLEYGDGEYNFSWYYNFGTVNDMGKTGAKYLVLMTRKPGTGGNKYIPDKYCTVYIPVKFYSMNGDRGYTGVSDDLKHYLCEGPLEVCRSRGNEL